MKLHRRAVLGGAAVLIPGVGFAQPAELPPEGVRQLIADAVAYARSPAAQLWPGYAAAPFDLLLITDTHEYSFFHDDPLAGFTPLGRDPMTGATVQVRERKFAPNLLATFPAVSSTPAIVVGTPEGAGRSTTNWAVTLLHEHFHQLQYTSPGYDARVDALDLKGGDQTGMWMLNYPFPYAVAAEAGAHAAAALAGAVETAGTRGGAAALAHYKRARAAFRASVSAKDWRYFAFQCWQEGIARHTEIVLAERSPHPEWRQDGAEQRRKISDKLRGFDLKGDGRVAVYSYGASEGMLLDRWNPSWRARYFAGPLSLDQVIAALG